MRRSNKGYGIAYRLRGSDSSLAWVGPGTSVRSRKPGPAGGNFKNSLVVKNDDTDYLRGKKVNRA